MRLFVVIEQSGKTRLASAIDAHAVSDWRTCGNLSVWTYEDGRLFDERGTLSDWTATRPGDEVLVSKGVPCPVGKLSDGGIAVSKFALRQITANPRVFESVLKKHGLHWFEAAVMECAKWGASKVDRHHASMWLHQFEKLGARWLGEKLLRMVRVCHAVELNQLLRLDRLVGSSTLLVGTLSQLGKSGGTLAHIIQKCTGCTCLDAADALDSCHQRCNVTVELFEDGLWTGIEADRVFSDLDARPSGRRPKMRVLTHRYLLRQVPIALNFAVKTDLGVLALKAALQARGLDNVTIRDDVGETYEVLTDSGRRRLLAGRAAFEEVRTGRLSDGHVTPMLFRDPRMWADCRQVDNARDILGNLGVALWIAKGPPFSSWDEVRLSRAALGSNSIGGTTVFSHGAPLAALPVLWGKGPVPHGRQTLLWHPLFAAQPITDGPADIAL